MSGAGEVNGKKPIQQTTQTGAQTNTKPVQEAKTGNVPMAEVHPDQNKGLKVESHNQQANAASTVPEEKPNDFKRMWAWANKTPENPTFGDYAVRTGKQVLAGLGTVGMGVLFVLGGWATSCSKDNSFHQEVDYNYIVTTDSIPGTPGTPDTVIPAAYTPEEFNAKKTQLFDSTIKAKNNENPTTADGVGYRYQNNGDGTGSVIIKNKDGSDSNIKLGFNTNFEVSDEKTDPATGDYTGKLTLTATENATISNGNVYDYINIIGDKFNTADNVGYNFTNNNGNISVSVGDGAVTKTLGNKTITVTDNIAYIDKIGDKLTTNGVDYSFSEQSGNAKVTYGNTGFTHMVGDSAAVDPTKPLGKVQNILTTLGILPDAGDKIVTETQTSTGAWGTGKGVHFEVVPGDLKEITQKNPTVKMAFNDMQGHNVQVEGKLEIDGDGIKITDNKSGKVLTIHPQSTEINNTEYAVGATVTFDGKEEFRMAKDKFNNNDATILAHVEHDEEGAYTDTDTYFKPNPPKLFDGTKAAKDADDYYTEKEKNLTTAITEANTYFDNKKISLQTSYTAAVQAIYGTDDLNKKGTVIPGTPGTPGTPGSTDSVYVHTESDIDIKIH